MNINNRRRYKNLALVLTGIFFGLFFAELTLRFFKPPQLSVTHMPCIYIKDEQLGYRYEPNATGWIYRNFEIDNIVKTNSLGFHDIEHDMNDKVPRLLVIGDSFTASTHIDISKGWTQTLQKELRKMGYPSMDVVNLGLDGTGTNVHLALLNKYIPTFKPDLVILAFYENDVEDVLKKRKFRECNEGYVLSYQNDKERSEIITYIEKHNQSKFSSWLFNNIYLFRVMSYLYPGGVLLRTNYITPIKVGIKVDEKATTPVDIDGIFKKLTILAQQHKFILLVIPVPSKNKPTASIDTLRNNISESMLAQIDIVDISPIIQELLMKYNKAYNELFWKHDDHLNAFGNLIFGLASAEVIKNYLDASAIDR